MIEARKRGCSVATSIMVIRVVHRDWVPQHKNTKGKKDEVGFVKINKLKVGIKVGKCKSELRKN